MKNVTLTISITAAEAARAGVDQCGDTTVVVEPSKLSEGARLVYAYLSSKPVESRVGLRHGRAVLPLPIPATPETVADWLEANAQDIADFDARQKVELAAKVERNRMAVRRWVDQTDEELVRSVLSRGALTYEVFMPSHLTVPEDMKEIVAARTAQGQLLVDRMKAEAAQNIAKVASAAAAAAARRTEQLALWLATKGSESMRRRAARNLLPEEDLVAAIRNDAFAPLDAFKRFERMTDADVRKALDCPNSDMSVTYDTRVAESAHDEDIDMLERIEALVPGATCTLMAHEGKLEDDDSDASLMRYSVRVEIQVGEFEFSREYSVGEAISEDAAAC